GKAAKRRIVPTLPSMFWEGSTKPLNEVPLQSSHGQISTFSTSKAGVAICSIWPTTPKRYTIYRIEIRAAPLSCGASPSNICHGRGEMNPSNVECRRLDIGMGAYQRL